MVRAYRSALRNTPQSEPLDSTQVKNNAGGYVFGIDPWTQLERFLILGTEGGTYYVGEQKLTRENINNFIDLIKQDGKRVVDMVVAVSDAGRAPKNDPALFVLAACAKLGDEKTRQYANSKVGEVARIGTHLLHYASFIEVFGGWGRGTVRSFQNWFTGQTPDQVAYQAVKYANRDGWTMRDLLRLSHPKSAAHDSVFWYITDGEVVAGGPKIIEGTDKIKKADGEKQAAALIREYKLPREVVPTQYLDSKLVWQALIDTGMGMTALVRNLGKLTAVGLLDSDLSEATKTVVEQLSNQEAITKSRIHPMQLLVALKTYAQGHGDKGKLSWKPVRSVSDALDSAFYMSYGNVEPTGKNIMLALDVSGSMDWSGGVGNIPLTPREVVAAVSLVTANVEKHYQIMGFATSFIEVDITPKMRLDAVCAKMRSLRMGSTDCALPMIYATQNNLKVDAFCVYTDNETWAGRVHPKVALQDYRNKSGIHDARQVVVATTPSKFSIADPADPYALDVAGFDTAVPQIISDFIRG